MALPDALPDAPVPEAPYPLPDRHRADAILPAPRASDASDGVLPDEAPDAAVHLELADVRCAGKLAAPEPVFQVPDAKHLVQAHLEEAAALCTPVAGQSAA